MPNHPIQCIMNCRWYVSIFSIKCKARCSIPCKAPLKDKSPVFIKLIEFFYYDISINSNSFQPNDEVFGNLIFEAFNKQKIFRGLRNTIKPTIDTFAYTFDKVNFISIHFEHPLSLLI